MGKDINISNQWEESSEDKERETLNPYTNRTHSTELLHADLELPTTPRDMDMLRGSSEISSMTQVGEPPSPWSSSTTATTTERPTSTSSLARECTSDNTSTAVLRPDSPPETSCPSTRSQRVPPFATSRSTPETEASSPKPQELSSLSSVRPRTARRPGLSSHPVTERPLTETAEPCWELSLEVAETRSPS